MDGAQPMDTDNILLMRHLAANSAPLDRPTSSPAPSASGRPEPAANGAVPPVAAHDGDQRAAQPPHDAATSALTPHYPSTPSEAGSGWSPRPSVTPQRPAQTLLPSAMPGDRALPPRDVTDDTIDDAYVAFILYCNPVVAPSTDSTELRRSFRAPPRSDGKTFSTFTLLELLRKFESKEIKTWTQLAIQLGVEPPVMEKNQSAQKVQQYAVRLKRWMHAMHVDAFFEHCMGKPHAYYTHVPPPHAPYPEHGRDGVPLEEDLALRALHPESKPKRGRRKADSKDGAGDGGDGADQRASPAKRPHLDTSVVAFAGPGRGPSPTPGTARSDEAHRYDHLDPWTAASAVTPTSIGTGSQRASSAYPASAVGQHFRWRLNTRDAHSPLTPHPHSAVTPSTGQAPDSGFDEPQSAVTPSSSTSKGRARRRHGPAVSSAWPSSGNPLTGKLRGRPPSNRSVRDGPFSTFPANPKTREGPVIDLQGPSRVSTPAADRGSSQGPTPPPARETPPQAPGRPTSLHLHVPQNTGGPVRLATPTVLVNGAAGELAAPALGKTPAANGIPTTQPSDAEVGVGLAAVTRALTTRFLRADSAEGVAAVDFELARTLASGTVAQLRAAHDGLDGDAHAARDAAAFFGLAPDLGLSSGAKTSIEALRVVAAPPPSPPPAKSNGSRPDGEARAASYRVQWTLRRGGLTGDFSLSVAVDTPTGDGGAESDGLGDGEHDWKARFLALQKQRAAETARLRRAVLDAVL